MMDCNVSFINLICFGDATKLLILQLPEWLCCNEWAQPKVFIPCYRCSANAQSMHHVAEGTVASEGKSHCETREG